MSRMTDTDRVKTTTATRSYAWSGFVVGQDTLRRLTLMIQLAFGILDGLIGLRFLLKLMAANPANPFAQFIYFVTTPFLWVFQGLTQTPSFEGIVIEFYDLIALAVYAALCWVIIQFIWILFARLR